MRVRVLVLASLITGCGSVSPTADRMAGYSVQQRGACGQQLSACAAQAQQSYPVWKDAGRLRVEIEACLRQFNCCAVGTNCPPGTSPATPSASVRGRRS